MQDDPKAHNAESHIKAKLLAEEFKAQDDLQLTVDFIDLPDLPCSESLMADTSDHQDEVLIDDSISNVTVDDRVGFESKEGSSYDDNSLAEEVVEVCDAACQTEFTDSDTHSIQSVKAQSDSNQSDIIIARTTTNSIGRALNKRESTEAFLDATLHGTLLRRPDGASDPSLHKELLTPSSEHSPLDPMLTSLSNTLPHNTHLNRTPNQTAEVPPTIKLQPYLSTPKIASRSPQHAASTLPKAKTQSQPVVAVPEETISKPVSKIKKLALFRQPSNDSQDGSHNVSKNSTLGKKSKGSKLPSLRLSAKTKDSKASLSLPSTPKKSETSKKVSN